MSGKHPRSNLPFNSAAVPQFRWQLTDGGSSPAPPSAAAALRAPRGSAAAAKRSSLRTSTCAPPVLQAPDPVNSLQRAWAHPDFLQRSWASSNSAAAAAASPAVAALLEAAKSNPLPAPKRLCVGTNAEAPSSMEVDKVRLRVELDDAVDEPCAKRNCADFAAGAGLPLPTTPRDACSATPPPASTAEPKTSLRPVPCDAPPAKVLRLAKHQSTAALRPRGKEASSTPRSTNSSTASAAARTSSRAAEPCSAAASAPTLHNEVATSLGAPAQPLDCLKPGSLPQTVSTTPIHCSARCKPIITREDLRRHLSSTPASVSVTKSRASATPILPVPASKRPRDSHFPPDHDFPPKRSRTASSSSLGEFAAFFQKK